MMSHKGHKIDSSVSADINIHNFPNNDSHHISYIQNCPLGELELKSAAPRGTILVATHSTLVDIAQESTYYYILSSSSESKEILSEI